MKTKRLAKLLTRLFFLTLAIGCENDILQQSTDDIESSVIEENIASEYDIERVSFDKIEILNKDVSILLSKQQVSLSRHSIDGIEFEVLEDQGLLISKGDYDSFTFPIILNGRSDDSRTYNLLISKKLNGDYQSYILSYDLEPSELEDYAQGNPLDWTGKIGFTSIDLEIDLSNFGKSHKVEKGFGGNLMDAINDCPEGECCEVEFEESRGTGRDILVTKIVDCGGGGGGGGATGGSAGSSGSGGGYGSSGGGRPNGGGTGSGSAGGGSNGNAPNPNATLNLDIATSPMVLATRLATILGIQNSFFNGEAWDWAFDPENSFEVLQLLSFLDANNRSEEAKELADWAISIAIDVDAKTPCGVGLDCVKSIEVMADGLRKFHGEEGKLMADYFDSLVSDFDSFTKAELQEFYDTALAITQKYNDFMFASIIGGFIEGVTPIVEIALFEMGLPVAIKLLQKIPVSWVYRGVRLNNVVKKVGLLGEIGTGNTIRIVKTNSPITKARELFNSLTKHKIGNFIDDGKGVLRANMGNGNFITYRPSSASKSNSPATISLDFNNIWSKIRQVKFITP